MLNIIEQILENEKIKYNNIEKSSVGFTNDVFFIDDRLVLKITSDEETKKQLEKETYIYQNIQMRNIPAYIASGQLNEYRYLIISKLKGKGLYSVWHKLTYEEKEDCVGQIADIIRDFNKHPSNFMPARFCYHNWKCHIIEKLTNRVRELKSQGYESKPVEKLIQSDLGGIFDENQMGLVYNDAHFDNFLYNEETKKLSLIDFDRVIYGAIDYEMLIFKTMCDNPLKFASEEDENVVFDEDFENVYKQFKSKYSEMFTSEHTEKRIKIYQFNYLLRQALEWKNPKSKIWVEKLLQDIKYINKEDYILTSSV